MIFDTYEPDRCCTDSCCGPGSWCCGRANTHAHDEDVTREHRASGSEPDHIGPNGDSEHG